MHLEPNPAGDVARFEFYCDLLRDYAAKVQFESRSV